MHLDPDIGLLLWTVATFGLLLFLLSRFAFKPLGRILQKREDDIRGALEDASKAREDARRIFEQNEQQLNRARDEARRIINEGHRIVAEMKQQAARSGKEEADRIVAQARSEVDREVQNGMDELKTTVANLSLRIARQVIKENLDETRHAQLAEDFVERLKKSHAARRT